MGNGGVVMIIVLWATRSDPLQISLLDSIGCFFVFR